MSTSEIFWILPVMIAFVIHFTGSVLSNFMEVQAEAIHIYKLKHPSNPIMPAFIEIPDNIRNRYISKTIFFWICCFLVALSALIKEGNGQKHLVVFFSFGLSIVIGAIILAFLVYKYTKNSEKIKSSNHPKIDSFYNALPWLDDFAMAVVCGEFAFFMMETFHL